MFGRLPTKGNRQIKAAALARFTTLHAQSRQPQLYERFGLPDTLSGRAEALFLHAVLTMAQEPDAKMNQALFDTLFRNLEPALIEAGVGDMSLGKRMRFLMQRYNERLHSLQPLLAKGDIPALGAALKSRIPDLTHPDALADYLLSLYKGGSQQKD